MINLYLIALSSLEQFCMQLRIYLQTALSWVTGDDIYTGSVCFDFCTTNIVHLSMLSMVA